MANFCLECFNELHNTKFKKRHVVLGYDLCEGCGEWKNCIVDFNNRKTFILYCVLAVAAYFALLSVLYFSGIYKFPKLDYAYEYIARNEYDEKEIIKKTSLYISSFEEKGFQFSQESTRIYSLKDNPEKMCYIELLFTDIKTYHMTLTVYMSDAPEQARRFTSLSYNQITIKKMAVDIYDDKKANKHIARFIDVTGLTCYIESYFGLNDTEYDFLSFLVQHLKRY